MGKVKVSKAQLAVLNRMIDGKAVIHWVGRATWFTERWGNGDAINPRTFQKLIDLGMVENPPGRTSWVISDTGRALVQADTAGPGLEEG